MAVPAPQILVELGYKLFMSNEEQKEHGHDKEEVHVSVITTAGLYPAEGYDAVPGNQKVRIELEKAVKHLKITDTTGWVARVGDRQIDVDKSYHENSLTGKVDIDYGKAHSGGGAHA